MQLTKEQKQDWVEWLDMYEKLVKNCFIPDVVGQGEQLRTCKYCGSDDIVIHQLTGFQSACNSCRA